MRPFQLRQDLQRAVINGFVMPLGVVPESVTAAPKPGYVLTYTAGEGDDPDTYTFRIHCSLDRLRDLIGAALDPLPEQIYGIFEIGSRDAYRAVDVYISREPVSRDEFRECWDDFEPILLEDGTVAAGANSEDPFVEIFLDQAKVLLIHVPLDMRDAIETMLHNAGLEELSLEDVTGEDDTLQYRSVLLIEDEYSPDLDELLLELRHAWRLDLDVDPERNIDDGGRELGTTLWHVVSIVEPREPDESPNGHVASYDDDTDEPPDGAYASFWLTAGSIAQVNALVEQTLADTPWRLAEHYSVDRVSFDDRPDELADLPPRPITAQVYLMHLDPWAGEAEAADG